MDIAENLAKVQANIDAAARAAGRDPGEITLVAATKTQSDRTIRDAIAAGIRVCGENRVQELTAHLANRTYEGANVHFIGHLQTNKVKFVVGRVDLIHSVSSEKLLLAIEKQAEKLGVVQPILLEVNLAGEKSKSGFSWSELPAAVVRAKQLSHVRLQGLMCIPPVAQRPGENLPYFKKLCQLAVDIKQEISHNSTGSIVLSMGMSGDYSDAILAGATHVRIGTALFGPRPAVPST